MSRSRLQHVFSFLAYDSGGKEYRINVFDRFVEIATRGGVTEEVDRRFLKTDDGGSVNKIAKGKYHIVDLGIDLTSDDPNAL